MCSNKQNYILLRSDKIFAVFIICLTERETLQYMFRKF